MADDDLESYSRTQLPYRAEYAKTSRAKCKKCSESMMANTLKLAIMTKSRWHDGFDAANYHVKCFFQLARPQSVAEIRHFETLKFEDQKMLEEAVESKGGSVLGVKVETASKKTSSKKKREAEEPSTDDSLLVNYDDFQVEYAKSSRAKCKCCEEKIDKDTVRLGKLDYNAETPGNIGPVPRWYHVNCFVKSLEQIEFFGRVSKIKGFKELEEEDRKMLKETVKPIKRPVGEVSPTKKTKTDEEREEEKLLKKQSDRFYALREVVDSMKRKDIETMLDYMDQKSNFKASSMLVDMATDVLLFGPLKKCPKCNRSKALMLRGTSYICSAGTENDPCNFECREPKRDVPDIPDEIVEKYRWFEEGYKFRGGQRIFPSKFLQAVCEKEAEINNAVLENAPLEGLSFGVISWDALKNDKTKIQKQVNLFGGKVVTALDRSVFVILTNKNELDKTTPKVEVAKALEVPLATDDFLFNIKTRDDVVPQLSKSLITKWEGDLNERMNSMAAKAAKTE